LKVNLVFSAIPLPLPGWAGDEDEEEEENGKGEMMATITEISKIGKMLVSERGTKLGENFRKRNKSESGFVNWSHVNDEYPTIRSIWRK
jgi:hypothetical protein